MSKTFGGEYFAPKVEIIEIKSRGVLCMSGDDTENWGMDTPLAWDNN